MDEGDQKRQLIDGQTEGSGPLRDPVEGAPTGVDRARLGLERARTVADRARPGIGGARAAIEDFTWFLRRHIAWPVEDSFELLGRRGSIGVFGGGGIAVAGVVAALVIAGSGGSGSSAGTLEAFVTPQHSPAPAPAAVAPAPKPKKAAPKPTGPTLHGAPPNFSPAQDVRSGVGDGKAIDGKQGGGTGGAPAERGATGGNAGNGAAAGGATASSNPTPAATAKIGATPGASASAQEQADDLATASSAGVAETGTGQATGAGTVGTGTAGSSGKEGEELTGPPAPKAAKKVARRFAEAFVVYEVGGVDTGVRKAFGQTSTKQLSRSLLHRPPRQPASVKVPQAKVVNVVAGPSRGSVYTVSVSLLRVGVTSELRLEMEQGVGNKWQVTNVFG
ncbi:MAG TPA: hypothetical protein VGH14_18875 [Solirubrobacterales bacterium]|jgi:hypothetical protein